MEMQDPNQVALTDANVKVDAAIDASKVPALFNNPGALPDAPQAQGVDMASLAARSIGEAQQIADDAPAIIADLRRQLNDTKEAVQYLHERLFVAEQRAEEMAQRFDTLVKAHFPQY